MEKWARLARLSDQSNDGRWMQAKNGGTQYHPKGMYKAAIGAVKEVIAYMAHRSCRHRLAQTA